MSVIRFPKHNFARCSCQECHCPICAGLSFCVTCNGAEGSLPTDCPGVRMSNAVETEVLFGRLDYRFKVGWVASRGSSWSLGD